MYKTATQPMLKICTGFSHLKKKIKRKQNWMSSLSVLSVKNNTGNRLEICMSYAVKNETARFLEAFLP